MSRGGRRPPLGDIHAGFPGVRAGFPGDMQGSQGTCRVPGVHAAALPLGDMLLLYPSGR